MGKRILSIDIMRGITLFLMLFVNDLYVAGVPGWLTHRPADYDGMGLADWVFPGFLFMVGLAIPYAIQNRINKGDSTHKLLTHIFLRAISLLLIGIFVVNISRLNEELTGMHKYVWAILVYLSVFLVWNNYRNIRRKIVFAFKGAGLLGLFVLALIYRAGTPEDVSWMTPGWWGILGLIGWGYLVVAVTYLFAKDRLLVTFLMWILFVALNILSQLNMLDALSPLKPVFGVILDGNVPSIVLSGLFFGLLLRRYGTKERNKFIVYALILGGITVVAGFVLRHWFPVSKIKGTPSWAMLCNGISMLVFLFLFLVLDVWGKTKWSGIFKPAGQNSLTTYLAPDFFYYGIWLSGFPVLFYKNSGSAIIVVLGSLVWAFLMIIYSTLLSKTGIRLKL